MLQSQKDKEWCAKALEEYDKERKLRFQKQVVAFTITKSVMDEFRKKYRKNRSALIEEQIKKLLSNN
jgi:hypothetical protein